MQDQDIELRVCNICDAPLPCDQKKLNFFNLNDKVCDDCVKLKTKG